MASVADIRMYPEDLATDRGKLAYFGTSPTAEELIDADALNGGAVVWWLWPGHLVPPSEQRLATLLAAADVLLIHHHTSGLAHVDDLARLVDAFRTARIVPIHSKASDRFADHFPRVEMHADQRWWEV